VIDEYFPLNYKLIINEARCSNESLSGMNGGGSAPAYDRCTVLHKRNMKSISLTLSRPVFPSDLLGVLCGFCAYHEVYRALARKCSLRISFILHCWSFYLIPIGSLGMCALNEDTPKATFSRREYNFQNKMEGGSCSTAKWTVQVVFENNKNTAQGGHFQAYTPENSI
jgi:hypothetical protein